MWSSNSTSGYTTQGTENKILKMYSYTYVRSNIMHNSQKVKETQVSINGWLDKRNVVHTYCGILFSLEKEGNSDTCHVMDEPREH